MQTLLHHLPGGQAGRGYRLSVARSPLDSPVAGLLDAARSPLHPVAAQTLAAALDTAWADPTRLNPPGRRARALLDTAREVLAEAVGVRPDELSVHPSPEAALELGLTGLRHARRRTGTRVVAGAAERSVVLLQPGVAEPVTVDRLGRVDPDGVRRGARGRRRRRRGAPDRERRGRHPPAGGRGRRPLSRARHPAAGRRDGLAGARPARHPTGRRVGRGRRRRVVRRSPARPARRAHRHPLGAARPPARGGARPRARCAVGAPGARGGRGVAADRCGGGHRGALGPRARRPGAAGRGGRARRRGRGRPRRPAPPRRDVQRALRRRRGAARGARPARPGGGVGLGVHLERAAPQPRARRDGRADPRQRAGHPAARGGVARRAPTTSTGCAASCRMPSPPCGAGSGRTTCERLRARLRQRGPRAAWRSAGRRRAGVALPGARHPAGAGRPRAPPGHHRGAARRRRRGLVGRARPGPG